MATTLQGTEKEIAWAEKIRAAYLADFDASVRKYNLDADAMAALKAWPLRLYKASFWINNRALLTIELAIDTILGAAGKSANTDTQAMCVATGQYLKSAGWFRR